MIACLCNYGNMSLQLTSVGIFFFVFVFFYFQAKSEWKQVWMWKNASWKKIRVALRLWFFCPCNLKIHEDSKNLTCGLCRVSGIRPTSLILHCHFVSLIFKLSLLALGQEELKNENLPIIVPKNK